MVKQLGGKSMQKKFKVLLSTVLFIPPLKIVFNVVSLSGNQYLLLIFCAIMPTVIIQLLKIIVSYKK